MKTILKEEGYPLALFQTYMEMVKRSVGSRQYQKLYVRGPNGLIDVIMNGDLACAYFVSSILTLCRLTRGGVHTTVDETILDMEASGWVRIMNVRRGAIVIWGSKACADGSKHRHIGFVLMKNKAISNISEKRMPGIHHITYGEEGTSTFRKIEAVYFHTDLLTK